MSVLLSVPSVASCSISSGSSRVMLVLESRCSVSILTDGEYVQRDELDLKTVSSCD